MNSDFLGLPRYQIAALLLHGMTHIWQQTEGHPAANGYHNREFQERSLALGIPCKPGRSCDVVDWQHPFRGLVMDGDPDAYRPLVAGLMIRERGESPLKKWSCGCTNVRAASEVQAVCVQCGNPFIKYG